MSASEWLMILLTGAVAGAVGQLVRTIAGIAGANRALPQGQAPAPFEPARLVVGMLVGATAGAAAALAMSDKLVGDDISVDVILGLAAAGYAGADFIEGVAGKFGHATGEKTPPAPAPPASPPIPANSPRPPADGVPGDAAAVG